MSKNKEIKPDWTGMLMEYYRTGKVPQCPVCGRKKIQAEKYYPSDRMVTLCFICLGCNAWSGFFDGIIRAND